MNTVNLTGKVIEIRHSNRCCYATIMCRTRSKNEFIDVTLFQQQSEFFNKWFKTGSWIAIQAHLTKSAREMSDGTRRQEMSVIVDNMEMVGDAQQQQQRQQQPQRTQRPQQPQHPQQPQQQSLTESDFGYMADDFSDEEFPEDDLPF